MVARVDSAQASTHVLLMNGIYLVNHNGMLVKRVDLIAYSQLRSIDEALAQDINLGISNHPNLALQSFYPFVLSEFLDSVV
jgi:hypothetical protein